MDRNVLLDKLQLLFTEIFQSDDIKLMETTSAKDIADWDSLNHAILIDKIEKQFEVKFDLMDMIKMNSVGDICDKILEKQNNKNKS